MLSSESNTLNNVESALINPSSSNDYIENNLSNITTNNTINTDTYTNVINSTIIPSNINFKTTSIEESSILSEDKVTALPNHIIDNQVIDEQKINHINNKPKNNLLEINRNSKIFYKMTNILIDHRGLICLMAIILTTYATYHNHVNRAPSYLQSSQPIFQDSIKYIEEFPDGELTIVQQRVNLEELSVILFYAPWCAQSLYVRDYFKTIAKIYQNYFYFAAVNCWQPGGECRLQHSKVKTWPVMVVYYPKSTAAIQYNGPWKLGPMYKFLNSTLAPIQRIHNKDELANLQKYHTTVIIGFFKNINSRYYCFYNAAVKWLEKDPFQNIRYVVVTGGDLENFQIYNQTTTIQIVHINGYSVYFANDTPWSVTRINNWVKKETKNLPQLWFNLNGNTNQSLMELLKKNPILIYLTKYDWLNGNQNANHILLDVIRNNSIFVSDKLSVKQRVIEKTDYNSDSLLLRTPKVPLDIPNNRTLTYILLDIYMFYKFAIKLGVTKSNIQANSSIVLIVDELEESVFILKEPISVDSIRQFVIDYKNNNLTRNLKVKSNLNVPLKSQQSDIEIENSSLAVAISIPEIDGKKFQQIIKNRTKTTLVLISSSSCSLCAFLMMNLLKMANVLKNLNIDFYKIDGIENDLTWQYTMGSFPTLIIFPINNDIRAYPQYMVPNEKNLLGFILANLNSPLEKLLTLLSYCKIIKNSTEFHYCINLSLKLVNDLIEINLRNWTNIKHNTTDAINEEACLHNNFVYLRDLYFILVNSKLQLKSNKIYKFEKFLSKNNSDKNLYCCEFKTN